MVKDGLLLINTTDNIDYIINNCYDQIRTFYTPGDSRTFANHPAWGWTTLSQGDIFGE